MTTGRINQVLLSLHSADSGPQQPGTPAYTHRRALTHATMVTARAHPVHDKLKPPSRSFVLCIERAFLGHTRSLGAGF